MRVTDCHTDSMRQYARFGFWGDSVSAAAITERLGMEPDKVLVRGSRRANPPRPVQHAWELTCDQPRQRVEDLVAELLGRLAPHLDGIEALATELHTTNTGAATLRIVRNFDTDQDEGSDDDGRPSPGLESQLLGWHLDTNVIAFLHRTRASIDIDEYP